MVKAPGDKPLNPREKRMKLEIEREKARSKALKKEIEVERARNRELTTRLKKGKKD